MGKDENHKCHKNWSESKSSTGMEAAAIIQGFQKSEELFGLRYTRLIADGDANVYHTIMSTRPYKHHPVLKIECTNHLLRNFCRKWKQISESG